MRSIPKILEPFIGKDADGEYLQLTDRNGYVHKLHVTDGKFNIQQSPENNSPVTLNQSPKRPEIHYDIRSSEEQAGMPIDVAFHIRRNMIPGEHLIIATSTAVYYVVATGPKSYVAWNYGISNDFIMVDNAFPFQLDMETGSYYLDMSSYAGAPSVLDWEVDPITDFPWIKTKSGRIVFDEYLIHWGTGGYRLQLYMDVELFEYIENPTTDNTSFRIKIWDPEDPSNIIYLNLSLVSYGDEGIGPVIIEDPFAM